MHAWKGLSGLPSIRGQSVVYPVLPALNQVATERVQRNIFRSWSGAASTDRVPKLPNVRAEPQDRILRMLSQN